MTLPNASPLCAQSSPELRRSEIIAAGAGMLAAAALDERIRAAAIANHSWALDYLAGDADPFGRAHYLVPMLVGGYLLPLAMRRRTLANGALRVGLGYAVADGVESVLKPLVGRHRPADGAGPWRFRLLSGEDQWHSFPSAHTVHAFAIAAGIAIETRSPWMHWTAYTLATAVGLERVYRNAHWSSDVVGSGLLAVATSTATVHWLRRDGVGPLAPPVEPTSIGDRRRDGPEMGVGIFPGALSIRIVF